MATRPDIGNTRQERYGGVAGRRNQEHGERWVRGNGYAAPASPDDDDARPDDAVSIDEVVERLSRDLSDAVNHAPNDDREQLRNYAAELVREDTAPSGSHGREPTKRARLSFFAVAVWLAVAGVVLAFLVPPAGVVCFVLAAISGVLAAFLGPGEARPERTADTADQDRPLH